MKEKPALKGLPATYDGAEAETLEVILEDKYLKAELILSYTLFKDVSVIARHAELIINWKR
ncbi:glycoside hydrolase family 36 N-terminal domain-containing protein [Sporolactobacillus sp. Y61]|uniref:Glycoside hydrolase family 36 N-terminal domain-containing protein n=1 Tax=Sporolactobacillus sp. Y61 TaxID=3160863 RepID=A0AAU8II90_9BACL